MLEFVPYTREWTGSVHASNERMLAGGLEGELYFPALVEPESRVHCTDALSREYYLAVEGQDVCGAVSGIETNQPDERARESQRWPVNPSEVLMPEEVMEDCCLHSQGSGQQIVEV
jgi:hypothetical protein